LSQDEVDQVEGKCLCWRLFGSSTALPLLSVFPRALLARRSSAWHVRVPRVSGFWSSFRPAHAAARAAPACCITSTITHRSWSCLNGVGNLLRWRRTMHRIDH